MNHQDTKTPTKPISDESARQTVDAAGAVDSRIQDNSFMRTLSVLVPWWLLNKGYAGYADERHSASVWNKADRGG